MYIRFWKAGWILMSSSEDVVMGKESQLWVREFNCCSEKTRPSYAERRTWDLQWNFGFICLHAYNYAIANRIYTGWYIQKERFNKKW